VTITIAALRAVGASQARADEILEPLRASCALYDITTPAREAAFLAQLGHESGGFRHTSEVWGPTAAQLRYEGRRDLGNTEPGDGSRFRGHGFIQTTGRANHARVRDRLRKRLSIDVPDFEAEPERLCELQWACLSAADYWDMRGLNALADAGEFDRISRAINLGNPDSARVPNGQADRAARWARVKQALGTAAPQELPLVHLEQADALPAPFVSTTEEDPTMGPFIAAALPALISAVPELARMFASGSATSERNIKAAEVALNVAKEAIGARNEQELVDQLQRDPEAASQVRQAVKDNWYRLEEVGGGISAARAANLQAAAGDTKGFWHQPAFWITLLLLPLVYFVVARVLLSDSFSDEVRSMVIAAVISGVLSAVSGFWLGTSFSSQKKTDLIAR
jgi:putative chitinase